jgi:hypothetical protein
MVVLDPCSAQSALDLLAVEHVPEQQLISFHTLTREVNKTTHINARTKDEAAPDQMAN